MSTIYSILKIEEETETNGCRTHMAGLTMSLNRFLGQAVMQVEAPQHQQSWLSRAIN